MITISRDLVRRVRSIFRRALGLTPSMTNIPVRIATGPKGLVVQASHDGFAVCYREDICLMPEEVVIPISLLKVIEGKTTDPVSLQQNEEQVIARWQEGPIPRQQLTSCLSPDNGVLPTLPQQWADNPPGLWQALKEALETTDKESLRYALGGCLLRGAQGDVTATDGRQAFRQGGFQFGFDQELLVRPATVFAAKELPPNQTVRVGLTADHVVLATGGWTIWLPVEKQGRFPRVDDVIPTASQSACTVRFHEQDARFLLANLLRLPASGHMNEPVTLDLGDSVVIRSQADGEPLPTELVLQNSLHSGDPVLLSIDRRYLHRAVEMGLRELRFHGPNAPVCCQDDRRTYVWAVLGSSLIIPSKRDALRIESPSAKPEVSVLAKGYRSRPASSRPRAIQAA